MVLAPLGLEWVVPRVPVDKLARWHMSIMVNEFDGLYVAETEIAFEKLSASVDGHPKRP